MRKKEVFIVADNIISPLGATTAANFSMLTQNLSGVKEHTEFSMSDQPFFASLLNEERGGGTLTDKYTRFEKLLIRSIEEALSQSPIQLSDKRTILIISTTKGNIGLLETNEVTEELNQRVALHTSASILRDNFQCAHQPIVLSNACISGSLALLLAKRLINSGQFDHAVVSGADTISKFIFSGFQSFQAISPAACKPFDKSRLGINLGEGAGTMILSSDLNLSSGIQLSGGSTSNDANHISGPSRTGQELCQAINHAMKDAGVAAHEIGLISAHGTATLYNDEMEALAVNLAGLQEVPLNSLKGFYGHTLGAAGIIESIISAQSLQHDLVMGSKGFETSGVSMPLNISSAVRQVSVKHCLKMASGFGGCNAAIILSKQSIN
ncbi:MAG: beta-ketoacyl synthase N-terminal-like domain-containing protein [Bacteroidota bacterium]|nr:beta-ketoacyl synthase N-terminal-like domain-containing protein [Ferruginibacter sp.]